MNARENGVQIPSNPFHLIIMIMYYVLCIMYYDYGIVRSSPWPRILAGKV